MRNIKKSYVYVKYGSMQRLSSKVGGGDYKQKVQFKKVVCMKEVGGHVLCSTLMAAFGSSKIPASIASMYSGMFLICGFDYSPWGDLCYKHVLLGLMCLCSYPSLLPCVPSVFVLGSYQSGLCRSVGICCMGSGTLLLLCPPWLQGSWGALELVLKCWLAGKMFLYLKVRGSY